VATTVRTPFSEGVVDDLVSYLRTLPQD